MLTRWKKRWRRRRDKRWERREGEWREGEMNNGENADVIQKKPKEDGER